jgi:HAD superfamily hydrolase (TIGR01549 family)
MIARGGLKAVFLDMDDTLCDTEGLTPRRLEAVHELLDGEIDSALLDQMIGEAAGWDPLGDAEHGRANRLQRMKDALKLDDDQLARLRARYNEVLYDNLKLIDGVSETLAWLRERVKLGLITNGPSELQRTKIARLGIGESFDSITISGEVGFHKPDPELFHAALKSLGTEPDAALYAGDRPEFDIKGSQTVGITAVLIQKKYDYPLPVYPVAEFEIEDVTHVSRLIIENGWLSAATTAGGANE